MSALDAIPAALRAEKRFVVWKHEQVGGKPKKTPYRIDFARRASSTEPDDWTTLDDALGAVDWGIADGIGYALPARVYTLVDLDDVVNGDGELHSAGAAILAALDSYSEWSQSRQGVHVIVAGRLSGRRRQTKKTPWGGKFEAWDNARFVYLTGDLIRGTPATIEPRQAELELVLAEFLPPAASATPPRPAQPIDVDDEELLERARRARNGADFDRLYRGDTNGFPSPSEADLALCRLLAFWAGRDPARIDWLFRSSGLMREKWERADYRERTIAAAIDATSDVYTPPEADSSKVRPRRDAPGTRDAVRPEDGGKGVGASRVPAVKGRRDGTHLPTSSVVSDEETQSGTHPGDAPALLEAEEAKVFASVDEASAKPLLGDDEDTVLAAGGSAVYYGDGGAGKTTLGLDRAFHYCAGLDWLGIAVPHPLRVLWIENEGPRGKFRTKVRAKLEAWDGPPLEERLHVLVTPWARFTFAYEAMRVELVELVGRLEIDVVIAGPIARLGAQGGGTPEQIQEFVDLLELVRAALERPLAYELIHHENKAGDVSGAWEGATDTLVHVRARGNGHTTIVWQKARWAPGLHGRTWKLNWRDGERFDLDETPETTDDEIADKLIELVRAAPGQSWNKYDELLSGQAKRKRAIRDELLEDGRLVNLGTEKAMRLFLPEQVAQTNLDDDDESPDEAAQNLCVQSRCSRQRVPGSWYCDVHGGGS